MKKPQFTFISFPVTKDQISLRRLVQNPAAPQDDFFDPTKELRMQPEISSSKVKNFLAASESTGNINIQAAFTSYASTFFKNDENAVARLRACTSNTIRHT